MIYVRWKAGESRRVRECPPLDNEHPARLLPCPACELPIGTQRPTQMVAVGPITEDEHEAHDAGRWHTAGAALLHLECADFLSDRDLDVLVSELVIRPEPAGDPS